MRECGGVMRVCCGAARVGGGAVKVRTAARMYELLWVLRYCVKIVPRCKHPLSHIPLFPHLLTVHSVYNLSSRHTYNTRHTPLQ